MGTARLRAAVWVGMAGVVAVAAACGEGGPKGISKAEYLGRASRVCQEGNQALTEASDEVFADVAPGQTPSQPQMEEFVRTAVLPTLRDQVERLRAIPAPKGRQSQVDEIYDALEAGLGELERNPGKLTDGSNVFADAEARAEKYGLRICATAG